MWITPQHFNKKQTGSIDTNLSALWKNSFRRGKEKKEMPFHGTVEVVESPSHTTIPQMQRRAARFWCGWCGTEKGAQKPTQKLPQEMVFPSMFFWYHFNMIHKLLALIRSPSCRLGAHWGDLSVYGPVEEGLLESCTMEKGFTNGRLSDAAVEQLVAVVTGFSTYFDRRLDTYLRHDERFLKQREFSTGWYRDVERKLLLRLLGAAIQGRCDRADRRQLLKLRENRPFFDDEPDQGLYWLTLLGSKINWRC